MDDQLGDSQNFDTSSNGEDAELYLLKWNSHQHHFANKFSDLLDEDDISFADVTLACEGNFLQAHRLVLSVCSPYFKNLFKVNSAEKGPVTILMANVRYTDLENILHFMYRGQVNVRKEDLNKFLETGEQLQIDGLMGHQKAAQSSNNKQSNAPVKRRFSEGGQMSSGGGGGGGVRSSAQQNVASRNGGGGAGRNSLPPQTQYKIVTGGAATATSRTPNVATSNSDNNNPAKKSRISPFGTAIKADTASGHQNNNNASTSTNTSRRPSTASSQVSNANSNSSPSHLQKVEEVDNELAEANNGIKILAVASMNAATTSSGFDDGQGNEVYEILDYEGDDGGEMEDSDLVNAYEDDAGDDGMYYYHNLPSNSPYVRNSSRQQSPLDPQVTARYPSIIDGVHFELISADEKRVAAQCKLCPGEKVIRGSGLTSSNFISHLRAFHKRELEEWREKRKTESRRRMDNKLKLDLSLY